MDRRRFIATMVTVAMVLFLASSCNSLRPAITSLEAEAEWTAPLGSLLVTCNASSPDGEELSYEWSVSGGNIAGTGSQVVWTAPEEVGVYDITVVVEDSQGRTDTASIALIASNGPPPVIEDLHVTAIGHPYLKKTTAGYKVVANYNYAIDCIASGNGTLSYNWTCTDGNISGTGSNITWTAPNTDVNITVAVTMKVFDGTGNWVTESIIFEVLYCPSCENW